MFQVLEEKQETEIAFLPSLLTTNKELQKRNYLSKRELKDILKGEQRKKSLLEDEAFGLRDDKDVDFVGMLNPEDYKDHCLDTIIVLNVDRLQRKWLTNSWSTSLHTPNASRGSRIEIR